MIESLVATKEAVDSLKNLLLETTSLMCHSQLLPTQLPQSKSTRPQLLLAHENAQLQTMPLPQQSPLNILQTPSQLPPTNQQKTTPTSVQLAQSHENIQTRYTPSQLPLPHENAQLQTTPLPPTPLQQSPGNIIQTPSQLLLTSQESATQPSKPHILLSPEMVVQKYPMLRGVTKAGALSVKLARESFLGNALMKQCTVHGTRSQPSIPADKLQELKTVV